jgi:hypothetical protein
VEDIVALHLHALVMQYQELMINLSRLVRTGEIACMNTDESSEGRIMVRWPYYVDGIFLPTLRRGD